jgi:arsenate reductase (glutaredoxin)
MKRIYFLGTCDKCKKMLANFPEKEQFELIDIKKNGLSMSDLDTMYALTNSYTALFSKVARKYKEMNLSQKELSESEIRDLILSDYTFLKRPVRINGNEIMVGKL